MGHKRRRKFKIKQEILNLTQNHDTPLNKMMREALVCFCVDGKCHCFINNKAFSPQL